MLMCLWVLQPSNWVILMDVNKNLIERNTQYIVIFSDQLHLQMCEDRDWKYMQ